MHARCTVHLINVVITSGLLASDSVTSEESLPTVLVLLSVTHETVNVKKSVSSQQDRNQPGSTLCIPWQHPL